MTNAPKDAARLLEQKPSAPERLPQLTLALDNAATAAAEGLAQYFSAALPEAFHRSVPLDAA